MGGALTKGGLLDALPSLGATPLHVVIYDVIFHKMIEKLSFMFGEFGNKNFTRDLLTRKLFSIFNNIFKERTNLLAPLFSFTRTKQINWKKRTCKMLALRLSRAFRFISRVLLQYDFHI
ncbi:hypothetical protein Anas_04646 [Armadillidium nasatum]|uniref:Uncharacterized protein n=1 Tax=Armadillidium nasatum TaxID=96803 RepID=A0A5N5TNG8_9CRUS|nr:hypothetical protein Anas_04646 [Armadillidium nasatum]